MNMFGSGWGAIVFTLPEVVLPLYLWIIIERFWGPSPCHHGITIVYGYSTEDPTIIKLYYGYIHNCQFDIILWIT